MKKIIGAVVVAVGLLAGCSDTGRVQQVGGSEGSSGQSGAPTGTVATNSGGSGSSGTAVNGNGGSSAAIGSTRNGLISVDVRMRANDAGNYASLLVMANRITAFADGKPITAVPTFNLVNLANKNQAEKIGTLLVPADAKDVEIKVAMGAGGGFESGNDSGFVDTRSRVLSYKTTVNQLAKEGLSVIDINATRSFVTPKGDALTRVFVPNFRIW